MGKIKRSLLINGVLYGVVGSLAIIFIIYLAILGKFSRLFAFLFNILELDFMESFFLSLLVQILCILFLFHFAL